MSSSPDPPFETEQQGISLDELARAFSQVMQPERPESDETPSDGEEASNDSALEEEVEEAADESCREESPSEREEAPCPINPRTILEAMLFVGNHDNQPLTPRRAAELMRDVSVDEIPPLVNELNQRYDDAGAPYHVVGSGDGYRLSLRQECRSMGNRFFGSAREAKLSQAAIDVLALVAYEQPITGDKIHKLRGKPSRHVLSHLVRRGLLRIERPEPKRRTAYYCTTDRFLRLFNLESLEDLPQSEDDGPP